MPVLLKTFAALLCLFVILAVLTRAAGGLDEAGIEALLDAAQNVSPWHIALLVVALLSIDLLLAVPTLTVTLLAGFFLGQGWGSLAAFVGMTNCALAGYTMGRTGGDLILSHVVRDAEAQAQMKHSFANDGPAMILLSRSAPLLPEVTACLAGASGMRLPLFLLLHTASTVPYVLLATWLGSRMLHSDPLPIILAAIGVYAVLWLGWIVRRNRASKCERQT